MQLCLDLASCLPAAFGLNLHDIFLGLGDFLADRSKDDLDVAWVSLVRVDSSVRSVRAAAGFRSLLHDNVADDEVFRGKFVGNGVGLCVLQESAEELGRLDWPSTLSCLPLLSLCGSADTTVVSSERNAGLVLLN